LARFRPFRGIRFVSTRVGPLDAVVAPPYDVISPAARDQLLARSDYNVTRLILNPAGHAEAARSFRAWLADGTLAVEDSPAFYLYAQEFESDGPKRRVGVIGALHLEPFATGVVRRHERTFSHHKRDRLDLTREVRANLSPIFGLFSDPAFRPAPDGGWDESPEIDVVHEGVRSRVWVIRDPKAVAAIAAATTDRTVFIADGHHRYETALNYYQEIHDQQEPPIDAGAPDDVAEPSAHVLAFLGAFEDPGMVILPTHRELVSAGGADLALFGREIESRFSIERVAKGNGARERVLQRLRDVPYTDNAFVLAMRGVDQYWLLRRPAPARSSAAVAEGLDVGTLHTVLLGDALAAAHGKEAALAYSPDPQPLFDRVDADGSDAAFFMRPMLAQQMEEACLAGELLPQKSTYFYPKLLTGLVFHSLEKAAS
jgi:uncharacterized protein (DUF1015 family)